MDLLDLALSLKMRQQFYAAWLDIGLPQINGNGKQGPTTLINIDMHLLLFSPDIQY